MLTYQVWSLHRDVEYFQYSPFKFHAVFKPQPPPQIKKLGELPLPMRHPRFIFVEKVLNRHDRVMEPFPNHSFVKKKSN